MTKQLILSGGLGNQMFEYAFFLSCKSKGVELCLNRSLYEYNRMHNGYLLGKVFGVPEKEVLAVNRWTVYTTRFIRRYHPSRLVYTDKVMTYCEDAYRTRRPYYDGVFISEHYFKDIEEQVRMAFEFKDIDSLNQNIGNELLSRDSVSLHIRRGDFLNNPIYGVCDESYYSKAIDYMCSKVSNPVFYIFSDDADWSKRLMEKFGVRYQLFTHNQGADSYKDMYLMSCCRHNIIANSTFSWWGAWLNTNKNKIVVAPNKWTLKHYMDHSLSNWVALEA